jgi:hypothetical protein
MIRFPPVTSGADLKISATTFTTFSQCPAAAEARLQGVYGPSSRASFSGGLAHALFARHLNSGPIEDVGQAAREAIGSGLNPQLADVRLKPSELNEVIREVGALYERFRRLQLDDFEDAEVDVEASPAEGVQLVGRIDAVFRQPGQPPLLRDWKSGNLGEPEIQLGFYGLVWALARDEVPAEMEAVSVATGERRRTVPTEADLEKVAGRVATMVSAVRQAWATAASLDRVGGPWCRYCPLLSDCREGAAAVKLLSAE